MKEKEDELYVMLKFGIEVRKMFDESFDEEERSVYADLMANTQTAISRLRRIRKEG